MRAAMPPGVKAFANLKDAEILAVARSPSGIFYAGLYGHDGSRAAPLTLRSATSLTSPDSWTRLGPPSPVHRPNSVRAPPAGQVMVVLLDVVRRQWGGVEGYCTTMLGLSSEEIARLKARLVEPRSRV